jgi:1,4-alpha-glucan branching enzyme
VGAAAAIVVVMLGRQFTRPDPRGSESGTAVAFEIQAAASKVTLVGDFNGWDRAGTPLARKGATDEWRTTVALPKGVYRYAFLVDDARWVSDPRRAAPVDHDFGQPSSLLTVR